MWTFSGFVATEEILVRKCGWSERESVGWVDGLPPVEKRVVG
jgi:hypothetical protein